MIDDIDLAVIVARDHPMDPLENNEERWLTNAENDRHALLELLGRIAGWYFITHAEVGGHDHHCRGIEPCSCGWTNAEPALEALVVIPLEPTAIEGGPTK